MEVIKLTAVNMQSGPATGAASASPLLQIALCLLPALALGAAVPLVMDLPVMWAALVILAICGAFAAVVMLLVKLALVPLLRLLLLTSFWITLDINLFPIFKNNEEPPGLNISLTLILSLLLGAAWLNERRRMNERAPVFPRAFAMTLAAILLWCSLTVAYGAEGMLGIYGLWAAAASMFTCFIVAAHFRDRRALHQTLIFIAIIMGLNAILGIAQSLIPSLSDISLGETIINDPVIVEDVEVSRVRALFSKPNTFAWYLGVFLPVVIAPLLLRLTNLSRWGRALCVVAAGLGVVALILTYSRGSWIAFAVSALLMAVSALFILKADERKRVIFRFAGAAVAISLLAIPFSGKIISRLIDDDRGAAEIRLPMIDVALAMIADNPVLGVGLSSYESVMRNYDETPELVTEHFDWPVHNVYLHIAAETGLPGLLLFLALVVMASWRGWMVLRNSGADPMLRAMALGLMAGMAAYLITGLKEGSCFQTGLMRPFFLLCGLLLANERASRRTAAVSDERNHTD